VGEGLTAPARLAEETAPTVRLDTRTAFLNIVMFIVGVRRDVRAKLYSSIEEWRCDGLMLRELAGRWKGDLSRRWEVTELATTHVWLTLLTRHLTFAKK
jgi:hypothetical protein